MKSKSYAFLSLFILLAGANFCVHAQNNSLIGKTVKIGPQLWEAENLSVVTFRNGDTIAEAKNAAQWEFLGNHLQAAWCYYEFKAENDIKYGKLYNGFAVSDPRGLAPNGFRIPLDSDWKKLLAFLGEEPGKKLKNKTGWSSEGNGTNESGFSGLPGGCCNEYCVFMDSGEYGYWWYNEQETNNVAWYRRLQADDSYFSVLSTYKTFGFSVRCIKE